MNTKPVELRRIRDFGQCIADAFTFLKQHFRPLMKSILSIAGIFIVADMVSGYFHYTKLFTTPPISFGEPPSVFGTSYFLNLLFMLLTYVGIGMVVNAYIAIYLDKGREKPTVAEVWSYVTYYLPRVGGAMFIGYIALIIGFLLCVLPGIWMIPLISIIVPVIMIENATISYAFDRSKRLIRENWWPTFGVIVISGIIAAVPAYFIGLVVGILSGASVYFASGGIGKSFGIGVSLLQAAVQVTYVFPAVATSICYLSLVEQKDGTGILGRIAALDQPESEEDRRGYGFSPDPEEQY